MPKRDETQIRHDSLIVLIKTLHQALRAALDDELRSIGHTLPEQAVMATLARIPGASNAELARQFRELEARLEKKLAAHDEAIAAILSAIRQLMNPPPPKRRGIGFTADLGDKR